MRTVLCVLDLLWRKTSERDATEKLHDFGIAPRHTLLQRIVSSLRLYPLSSRILIYLRGVWGFAFNHLGRRLCLEMPRNSAESESGKK